MCVLIESLLSASKGYFNVQMTLFVDHVVFYYLH
jgi:hypothetical protein